MIRQITVIFTLLLTSCVYTLNIQQGNILDQKDINKLRAGLTKNQVIFVLGNPVVDDSFSDDHWIYLYTFSNRMTDIETTKRLELSFSDDKLIEAEGDFEIPVGLGGAGETATIKDSGEVEKTDERVDKSAESNKHNESENTEESAGSTNPETQN
ncbi:MAG: outer membrane protein assembly factor BamE [Kangiellaceae bacterium]|nr:outer membrane protein assembly factor BamE [Kangiellaceae bacterium]